MVELLLAHVLLAALGDVGLYVAGAGQQRTRRPSSPSSARRRHAASCGRALAVTSFRAALAGRCRRRLRRRGGSRLFAAAAATSWQAWQLTALAALVSRGRRCGMTSAARFSSAAALALRRISSHVGWLRRRFLRGHSCAPGRPGSGKGRGIIPAAAGLYSAAKVAAKSGNVRAIGRRRGPAQPGLAMLRHHRGVDAAADVEFGRQAHEARARRRRPGARGFRWSRPRESSRDRGTTRCRASATSARRTAGRARTRASASRSPAGRSSGTGR